MLFLHKQREMTIQSLFNVGRSLSMQRSSWVWCKNVKKNKIAIISIEGQRLNTRAVEISF